MGAKRRVARARVGPARNPQRQQNLSLYADSQRTAPTGRREDARGVEPSRAPGPAAMRWHELKRPGRPPYKSNVG